MRILILSSNDDYVSDSISSWLKRLTDNKAIIVRINWQNEVIIKKINLKSTIVQVNGELHDISNFDFIFYRRGQINFHRSTLLKKETGIFSLYLEDELSYIHSYIFTTLKNKMLSNFYEDKISKMEMLTVAFQNNVNVPDTIITSSKQTLSNFLRGRKVITKAVQKGGMVLFNNIQGGAGTISIKEKDLLSLPESFFPSLFQEEIPKEYEIRAFYLNGRFYSMAIFSQRNKKTKIDFRNYDMEYPNRTVPYKLSAIVEQRLRKTFRDLNLKTGSADLIKGKDGKYYFLEINPVGQFTQVSMPCNYQLEKKIAEFIIDKINETRNSK